MTDLAILKFLYEHPNRDTGYYTNLLDYFIDVYPNADGARLKQLKTQCVYLLDKGLMTNSSEFVARNLGGLVYRFRTISASNVFEAPGELVTLTLDLAKDRKMRKDNNIEDAGQLLEKEDGIMAILTIEGRKEYEGLLYSEQLKLVNDSLMNTNETTVTVNTVTTPNNNRTIRRLTRMLFAASAIYTVSAIIGIGLQIKWQGEKDKLQEIKEHLYNPTLSDSLFRQEIKQIVAN